MRYRNRKSGQVPVPSWSATQWLPTAPCAASTLYHQHYHYGSAKRDHLLAAGLIAPMQAPPMLRGLAPRAELILRSASRQINAATGAVTREPARLVLIQNLYSNSSRLWNNNPQLHDHD
ncbi:MAG: hypothetical protein IPO01_17585 [Chitinophagaceae bacterium]|nr:hypothetical protein [Chitinophagaceae bacterium]